MLSERSASPGVSSAIDEGAAAMTKDPAVSEQRPGWMPGYSEMNDACASGWKG
jgi:hypothetical protein